TCAEPVLQSFLQGVNGTIFAYGQTSAGKTFTMIGDPTFNFRTRGIAPRVVSNLFRSIQQMPGVACTVRVSYLEIYNDVLYDLLGDPEAPRPQMLEGPSGSVEMKNIAMPVVNTEQ
ncbi:kinesin-like protein, partial [Kipferlia bialata]